MLAARASAARAASRIARTRTFATVVDSAGVKVAAADNGEATSAVTFIVKAGSRFESKPGVAHALKNYAFKSTDKRSSLGTVREAELYGGVLSSSLSREHLAITAEFLRGDEAFFVDVLSSYLTSTKFTRYELTELVAPTCEAETSAALSNPATHAVELAHALAFRNGLGNSIFATPGHHLTADDVRAYAQSVFGSGNVAVLGTGIDPAALEKLLEKSLGKFAAAASPASTASKYFGGETRVDAHGAAETVFIGFGTSGAPSAELAVLAAHLDPTPSVKWSKSTSPIAAGIPEGSSVQAVYLPYSDASLFGLLVQAPTTAAVKEAGKVAVAALQAAGSLKGEELQKAIAKAKFIAASAVDGRDGLISSLGPKVSILSGTSASLSEAVSSLEKVDASAFSKASASLLKTKPTFVAVGDVKSLPYADELGL
ncbi:ubiquinol-cytochrome C reductase complex core protein 2 [Trametes versicolor FP-101664 SS1]|uniref:ubiquinol-cytochrome C reductase complex core protein 2 n=1 Tax=Trametes versicolor (strain FP-101664) TaxID=717944 RepID=UPI0004622186|nr:ubiquinol-cytochrome C reductase complex core protein 2 [Trametes versicolor FP-101664 SS1]EIW56375.1 ubiquinol-cytochrome C reductase complex core protein 2 [Trametes versicolor FP-101664 SS1]